MLHLGKAGKVPVQKQQCRRSQMLGESQMLECLTMGPECLSHLPGSSHRHRRKGGGWEEFWGSFQPMRLGHGVLGRAAGNPIQNGTVVNWVWVAHSDMVAGTFTPTSIRWVPAWHGRRAVQGNNGA